jgi:hypothetical protein
MKKVTRMLLVVALLAWGAVCEVAHADSVNGLFITDTDNIYSGNIAIGTAVAILPYPLAPPIASGYFYCNTSGSSAIPNNACAVTGAYTFSVGAPNTRSVSLSTAYQASNSAKPCQVTVNLSSTASLTLTTGTTNTALVIIGSTSAVASGTGTQVGSYSNSLTGSLVVGLNISTSSTQTVSFVLPAGWYFAVVPQTGTVNVASAFDQSLG